MQGPLELASGAATRAGKRRHNEDGYIASARLVAVADGMGGHAAGEVASGLALDALQALASLPRLEAQDVLSALHRANDVIFLSAREHPTDAGMGTTVTGLALVSDGADERVLVFNVGDSRTYRLRGDELRQLTTDHSLVQELIESGEIDARSAQVHPQRNVVTRVLGVEPSVVVDLEIIDLVETDRFLLCSDGLTSDLSAADLARLLAVPDPADAADALVDAALDAGSSDNVTAVVAQVRRQDGAFEADPFEDTQPRPTRSELSAVVPGFIDSVPSPVDREPETPEVDP